MLLTRHGVFSDRVHMSYSYDKVFATQVMNKRFGTDTLVGDLAWEGQPVDFQRMYRDKLATVDQVLDLLKSGDEIVVGVGPSESVALLEKLHTIWERVENVTVLSCLPMGPYEFANPSSPATPA